ncbi:MAG: hypothetical protein ABI137_11705 [Antricoccus sp.]
MLGVVAFLVAGYFVFVAGFGGIKNSAGKIDKVADTDKVSSANLGSDPRLVAPGIETTIGATNEYSTAMVDNRLSKAANGEALYQVSVSATKGAINGSVDALYAVNIDGQEKPVNVPALSSPNFTILVSAPKTARYCWCLTPLATSNPSMYEPASVRPSR